MKRVAILILLIVFIYMPNVLAHEKFDDGWHMVVKNDGNQSEKEWLQQDKEWAYYENGIEKLRFSRILGAHRGWGTAPENSISSFRLTKDNGYYYFETDVRFTKDNVAVLCHDAKINNLARNNDLSVIEDDVLVADKTYAELKSNYIFNIERLNHDGATVLSEYNTNRIATFDDLLDFIKQNKMYVSIELKDGTKEQIESLVTKTQQKNLHNYIRWVSFRTDLLKYVKDFDDDELLAINKSDTCDSTHDYFCGEEIDYYLNKLKTDKNYVFMYTNPLNLPISGVENMPTEYASYLPTKYVSTTIPQGVVSFDDSSIDLKLGASSTISYNYNGDGTVKCESSDSTKLTCSVNNSKKQIEIKSINNSVYDGTIVVYATQGISHSASEDVSLRVKVDSEVNLALSHLKNIIIADYDINFDKSITNYALKIKDEKILNIDVIMDSNSYKYTIEGNKDLKNGSKILVNLQNLSGDTLATYSIDIKVDNGFIIKVPDTLMGISWYTYVLALILLVSGFSIIGYTLAKKQ